MNKYRAARTLPESIAYQKKLFGDFVSYKVGKRIRDTVHFSTRVDSQDPDLNMDE
jgi:hypothetical protein